MTPFPALRVQLSRRKGWRMPPAAVKVDRSTRWGNPFRVGSTHPEHGYIATSEQSVELFREYILSRPALLIEARRGLRGHDLACWCALNNPCHANVWLELVNETTSPDNGSREAPNVLS